MDGAAGRCDDAGVGRPLIAAGLVAVIAVTAVAVVWGAGLLGGDDDGGFPEGVYQYRVTDRDVLDVVPGLRPEFLKDTVGTFTWTVRDGKISLVQTDCACSFPRVSSTYTVAGDRLTVTWPKVVGSREFCSQGCTDTVRWDFDGKVLHVVPLGKDKYDVVFWGARKSWVKVG